ncbi:PREDICTED: uncharacterized protein LOC109485435, partial [Branchiostoma belcheri]|uniref:Uncharacterized protein LOC109485435 n=1 Tax=Branchiostoma belcheri TaxID=7741 RepID=A0A6P5ARE0_BRABE
SSGRQTEPVRETSGRQVRTVPAPPQGECVHITGGGTSGVHFYVCCNNCDESGGNPTCDRTTYQGASAGRYCGHCGADEGNGKLELQHFKCGGCAGQSQVQETCNKEYSWVFPGACWVWSIFFKNRCNKRFQQKARSLDSDAPFCGDNTCDPGETDITCPFDCCPVTNPDTCVRNSPTCPPECCSKPGCCKTSKSPTVKGDRVVVLAAISVVAFAFTGFSRPFNF